MHQELGEKALNCIAEVEISFYDAEGTAYKETSYFDFNEYKGISQLGSDPLHKISSQLEKIQKDVARFSNGFKRLKTDIYTSSDREKEHEERKRYISEQQNRDSDS